MNTNEILNAISTDADMNTLKEIIRTAQRRMKAVKAEHADSLGSNYETHPSYAMLSFTRSSSTGIGLFGSSIPHENVIRMVLKRGSERRVNNESWYCGEDTIASVEMSYSQFAEAISSFGIGDGVPVTLKYTETDGSIQPPSIPDTRDIIETEFLQHINKCRKDAVSAKKKAEAIVGKRTLTKSDKEELMGLMSSLVMDVGSNTEFLIEQFRKQMDKTITEAKGEVEAFTQNRLHSIALAALRQNPETLLLESEE